MPGPVADEAMRPVPLPDTAATPVPLEELPTTPVLLCELPCTPIPVKSTPLTPPPDAVFVNVWHGLALEHVTSGASIMTAPAATAGAIFGAHSAPTESAAAIAAVTPSLDRTKFMALSSLNVDASTLAW